jgi:hypothetical protein
MRVVHVVRALVCAGAIATPLLAHAADPTKAECIAANEKAQELRKGNKLTAARAQLTTCIATSCPGPVREDCAQRLGEIDSVMPAIIFEAKDGAGNDLAAVRVTIDGQPFAERLDGRALPVDPGEHRFVFQAEGRRMVDKMFIIRERDKTRRERIVMVADTGTDPTTTAPIGTTTATTPTTPPPAVDTAPGGQRKISTLVIVAGGVGVAGLAVGIITGLMSTSSHSSLTSECTGNNCPTTAQSDLDSFHSMRTISTIGYVVGAVGLVSAGVLYFTSPKTQPGTTSAGVFVGPTSAGFAGRF